MFILLVHNHPLNRFLEKLMTSIGSRYPGFNVIKLRAKGGMPVAFADFEVPHAQYWHFPFQL